MTQLTVDATTPQLTVTNSRPSLTVAANTLFANVTADNNVELAVSTSNTALTVSGDNNVQLTVPNRPISVTVAAGTTSSGGSDVNSVLASLRWGTPSGEVANSIEITGTILAYDSILLLSSVVDVEVTVTDGATDNEPSHTATLAAASSPVGTVLAGSGTATMVIRSSGGSLAIAVHEATANCHRYLWIKGAGHERLWIRAESGVQELVFA